MNANRKVQEISLEIVKNFIEICEKHNLRYYFIGGSLIGVLRHKGFIPWDDDIDIGLPRKDYEKFLEIADKELNEGYFISSHKTDPSWYFNMVQIMDKETVIEICSAEKPRKCYVWVDVFPIDGLPSNKINRLVHAKRVMIYRYLIQLGNIDTQVDKNRINRPWYEKSILTFFKLFKIQNLIDSEKYLEKLNLLAQKYDFYSSEYAANLLGRYREREIVPQRYFGIPEKCIFENIEVNIPEDSHSLQTALYGDYMKLPPENERVGHSINIIRTRKKW